MKKTTKILLFVGVVGILTAALVWKFVNKPVNDYSSQQPTKQFTFTDIINKVSNDTASLIELKDKLVAIDAQVKKMTTEGEALTVELGDTNSMSSIICQVDKRYLKDFDTIKPGANISIQGIITGYSIDTELGLGNTIEMNFCTLKK